MKKTKLWQGLVAVMSCLLVLSIETTSTLFLYSDAVNSVLGGSDSSTGTTESDEVYFESKFGPFNEESEAKLIAATREQTTKEMEEGAVLLKNENTALPLQANERSITIFGASSVNPVIKCHSSGNTAKGDDLVSMSEAFTKAGFELNTTLSDAYGGETKEQTQDLTREINEKPASFYTDAIKSSWSKKYNDVAIIFLSREQGEGNDFSMKDSEGKSQLALHDKERELVKMVTSDPAFKKVIAILNIPTSMEVGWLEEYGVDACLWIGAPGQTGFTGMVNLLTGEKNPSGHLVDAYATNSLSAPAVVNSGTNTREWGNLEEVKAGITSTTNTGHYKNVTVQQEGIYVGYKYYETRYEDCVLGNGNASASVGSLDGKGWEYSKEVSYPFGYGLSYTDFTQTLNSVKEGENNTYTLNVTVTNTGAVKGKSVVQVYAQTPYGDYEKTNRVEKSSVQIVGFAKTKELEPNESCEVEVTVDKYLLASYDYTAEKGYILSEGDYYFAIGEDAHDALNNILAAKGKTVADGMDENGDAAKVYSWKLSFDNTTYDKSVTGVEVTNQFDDCDLNYWTPGSCTYLTRSDWQGTFPKKIEAPIASADLIKQLNGKTYQKPVDAPAVSSFEQGKKNNIVLLDMMGKEYDDENWESYLDQMTLDELAGQLIESFTAEGVASVGKPSIASGDGMDSINYSYKYGTKHLTANYTSMVTLSCTWNPELHLSRGELMGEEGLWCRNLKNHSVGGDLHRTQFGGRNFEYISEDGNMCGFVATNIVLGMNCRGVNAAMKHMAGNDQEFGRTGLCTFFNEQAYRETALRMYELAVTKGNMKALMTGLNRLGGTFCTQSKAMLTNVLREEWGFQGATISDADSATYGNVVECLEAGLDLFCCDFSSVSANRVKKAINDGDGHMLERLRNAVKNTHFIVANCGSMNGLSKDTVIATGNGWWAIAAYVIDGVVALAWLGVLFGFLNEKYDLLAKMKKGG